jgi:hypothetical protein
MYTTKSYIIALLVTLALATAVLLVGECTAHASPRNAPSIVSQEPGPDVCADEQCTSRKIVLRNPLREAVWVYFYCGDQFYSVSPIGVRGRSSVTAVIKAGIPIPECRINSWTFQKNRRQP